MWITPAQPLEAADTDARRIRGVAIPYGQEGYTSAGPVTVDAGAIRVPGNLRGVKLFREHGRTTPLGYATDADDTPDQLTMAFQVARTPDGDQALLEASEGLRDALSVELNNVELKAGHVVAADLVAVAQVAVPAFAGAQLVASLTDEEQAQVHDLASQIVDATAAAAEETPPPDAAATTEQENRTMTEATAAPATMQMAPPARTTPRGLDFEAACAHLAAAYRDSRPLYAALTDIIPSDDAGGGVFRPQWLDELWTPVAARRQFIEAINRQNLTSGLKVYGWKWATYPTVDDYAGDKGPVPSSDAATEPVEADVTRLAGGWDLDRIFVDLGAAGFIESFYQAAARDLAAKQEAAVAAALVAAATADGSQADVFAGVADAVASLVARGATPSFVGMSADLWAEAITTNTATVPWWVPNGANPSLKSQTGSMADIAFFMAPALAAATILAGDRSAATFFEPSASPIRVNAVNLPNGGVDLGIFSYQAILVNDARGLSKVTVT